MITVRHASYTLVSGILVLSLVSLGTAAVQRHDVKRRLSGIRSRVDTHPVSYAQGRQILFVYIGSEDCGFSLMPGFDNTIGKIASLVRQHAVDEGSTFSTLGVSLGPSVLRGVEYLERFGSFDEIAVGHGQLNTVAMRYLWEDFPAEPSFPQVAVVERVLTPLNPGYVFDEERVLVRVIGVPQIEDWADDDAPFR